MSNIELTTDQQDKFLEVMREIMRSRFVDPSNPPTMQETIKSYLSGRGEILKHYKPDAFDYHKPEVWCRELWEQYVSHLALDGRSTKKKGSKGTNASRQRGRVAKQIAKQLKHTPTAADLKEAFPTLTQLDDDLCKAMDRDLENLTR